MARPIDADGFLDRNAEFANREFIHPKYQVTLRELVDSEPTLSPDDVRGVGELERDEYEDNKLWGDYCSLCCSYFPYGLEWKPNYCPNCGARMKGAEDGTTYAE